MPLHFNVRGEPHDADPEVAADIRQAMVEPLFERPFTLAVGHCASLMLSVLAICTVPGGRGFYFVATEMLLIIWRCANVVRALRLRREGGLPAMMAMVPAYYGVGLAWSCLGGVFFAWTSFLPLENHLRVMTIIVCAGTCSGIAGRNSGTPAFARAEILLWLVPPTAVSLFLGCWEQLFALMLLTYTVALCSIVTRLHRDLLKTLTVQRTNAALVAHFDAALSNMSQGLLLYDRGGTLKVVNKRFFALFGLDEDQVRVGQTARDVLRACLPALRPDDRGTLGARSLEDWAAHGDNPDLIDLADGRAFYLSHKLLADGGRIATYVDVTERVRREQRIVHMARHDALTDLPNRILFHERADQAIARLGRGEPFAIACFDLNKFKTVNDTLGHGVGDQLLQQVAFRLGACVREVDLAARLGGDEFAMILPGLRENSEAELLTQRLTETISAPYTIDGHDVRIGVSIGWALAPRDGTHIDALMRHADQAMYDAKAASRQAVSV